MELFDFKDILTEWGWLILAAVLIVFEILAPGIFFLFFAFAAFIVAGITWIFDIDWQIELLVFSAVGIISMYAGRRYFKTERVKYADHPINDPMAEQIGKIVTVQQAISNGIGKTQINDSLWTILGPDAEIGANVKIIAKQDDKFIVELVLN